MAQVVVVGSYNQDFIWRTETFPVPGETRLGWFSTGPGGKGFNQAVAAARQGVEVSFIAALGRDAIGEAAARLASDERIDAHWQWCDEHPTGNAAIVLDERGQNFIIVGSGANLALSVAHVEDCAELIQQARVVLVQHEITPEATARVLQLAHEAGVITVLNPAPPLSAEKGGYLPWVDVLTPNETEFSHVLKRTVGITVAPESLVDLTDEALHQLACQLPVPTVVITLGAAGVFVSQSRRNRWGDTPHYQRIAAEAVQVCDTTGAGDAFSGSLAACLAESGCNDFMQAIRYANQVAGLATESPGAALAIPTRAQVLRRFA